MANKYIICVDDERGVLDGIHAQLHREFGKEFIIELAESGEEALEIIEEILSLEAELPIIISDQLMPGMQGHELLIKAHQITPNSFKVLLTGQSNIEAITEAVNKAQLYRYLEKPWESTDLILTIQEAIKSFNKDLELAEKNRLLKRHNEELEELVEERTGELIAEKKKSDELLLNILPEEIAEELKSSGKSEPQHFDQASVLFTDFKGFTTVATQMTPQELVETLNECFCAFDTIIERRNMEKIKTIGDAYMCAGGVPVKNTSNPTDAVQAAIEMLQWVDNWNEKRSAEGKKRWEIRVGIHTGELVAGVIGSKKFAYDVWGDAVNVASRMEAASEPGKINVSAETHAYIKDQFNFEYRGEIEVKNRGAIGMFFVENK